MAKEIKTDNREDLFAATPPLEAVKTLLSLATTEGIGYDRHSRIGALKLDFVDVRRAFFYAACSRDVYVDLPPRMLAQAFSVNL